MHICRRDYATDLLYQSEALDPIVELYAASIGPPLVLIDDNARPYRGAIVDGFSERKRIPRMEWPVHLSDLIQFKIVVILCSSAMLYLDVCPFYIFSEV